MASAWDRRNAYHPTPSASQIAGEWRQAGWTSIAYRLAHFPVSRTLALSLASAVFYFF